MSTAVQPDLLSAGIATRERLLRELVSAEGEQIARACHAIARSFSRGGTLIPFGRGAAASDAAHAAVEFMHPIIVGKRALPALVPTLEAGAAADLPSRCHPDDIALGFAHAPVEEDQVADFLGAASERGMLTIAMCAEGGSIAPGDVDYRFAVPTEDPAVVQEVHETIYHVFWELVHTFFEHPGLLEENCITCGDVAVEVEVVDIDREGANAVVEVGGARERVATELVGEVRIGDRLLCHAGVAIERGSDASRQAAGQPASDAKPSSASPGDDSGGASAASDDPSGFLYPFLEANESDLDSVLADVRASTVRKAEDVIELRARIDPDPIVRCGERVRNRLDAGGRLYVFGNGGSATDAQDLAIDLGARGWPASYLTADVATLTAIGNDVGFDKAFSRQLIPLGRSGDVAVAITTSGNSLNILAGLEEAHRRGMSCIAIAGYDGGRLAELEWLEGLFVVSSDYVPRIQEAQATIYHLLVETIGRRR